jgi:hypothetical protein
MMFAGTMICLGGFNGAVVAPNHRWSVSLQHNSPAFRVGRGFEGGAYREATCALGVSDSERGSEGLLGGDDAFLCNLKSYVFWNCEDRRSQGPRAARRNRA